VAVFNVAPSQPTVTLGGQVADRITVTPDMRGIIASFDQINWPPNLGRGPEANSFAPLVVWTSEGSDRLDKEVGVLAPADDALRRDCTRTEAAPSGENTDPGLRRSGDARSRG
jgi:hypothetical protein